MRTRRGRNHKIKGMGTGENYHSESKNISILPYIKTHKDLVKLIFSAKLI